MTLADTDHQKLILATNAATGLVVTVPDGLAIGLRVEFVQRDATKLVTLVNGGGAVVFLVPPGAAATPTSNGTNSRMVLTMSGTDVGLVHGNVA